MRELKLILVKLFSAVTLVFFCYLNVNSGPGGQNKLKIIEKAYNAPGASKCIAMGITTNPNKGVLIEPTTNGFKVDFVEFTSAPSCPGANGNPWPFCNTGNIDKILVCVLMDLNLSPVQVDCM